jgi:hypothetical protein
LFELNAGPFAQCHVMGGQIWDVLQECACAASTCGLPGHAGLRGNEDAGWASCWAVFASLSMVAQVQTKLEEGLRVATGCPCDTNNVAHKFHCRGAVLQDEDRCMGCRRNKGCELQQLAPMEPPDPPDRPVLAAPPDHPVLPAPLDPPRPRGSGCPSTTQCKTCWRVTAKECVAAGKTFPWCAPSCLRRVQTLCLSAALWPKVQEVITLHFQQLEQVSENGSLVIDKQLCAVG